MKMKIDVDIISKEAIKPCMPTPDDLRNYKLCSLDQIITPNRYITIVFFYPNHDAAPLAQILERIVALKKSLSEALTRFFPLAGRVKDGFSVDCDDGGASFTTSRVKSDCCSLSEFLQLKNLDLQLISRLFVPIGRESLTNIQATMFEKCGGIALGASISHKLIDGACFSFFFRSWANVNAAAIYSSKQCSDGNHSHLDLCAASSLFPPHDLLSKEASPSVVASMTKKRQFITRRYVFDGSAISALKDKANHPNCTRVVAVSAFIWKCAVSASASVNKPSLITQVVNLRKRGAPNFPEMSTGNLVMMATLYMEEEKKRHLIGSFPDLVYDITKSISEFDADYVRKLVGDQGFYSLFQRIKEAGDFLTSGEALDIFCFTSWCKFGFYETDFGWGKPDWVATTDDLGVDPFCFNAALLMDTKCGKGVEAWIRLDEQNMAALESNEEFRAFVSFSPSPLPSNPSNPTCADNRIPF